jgi:hypothetical protein
MGLTNDQVRTLIKLIESGTSIEDAALQMGITPNTARSIISDWAIRKGDMGAVRALRILSRGPIKSPGLISRIIRGGGRRIGGFVRIGGRLVPIIGLILTAITIYEIGSYLYGAWGNPSPATCPEPVTVLEKCPWSPEGYSVEPCTEGFCYDAGPQGALHCVQRDSVPNSGRTYGSSLVCNEGYEAILDPCTTVIKECRSLESMKKQWWEFWK